MFLNFVDGPPMRSAARSLPRRGFGGRESGRQGRGWLAPTSRPASLCANLPAHSATSSLCGWSTGLACFFLPIYCAFMPCAKLAAKKHKVELSAEERREAASWKKVYAPAASARRKKGGAKAAASAKKRA